MRANLIKTNFTAGEVSPRLMGRVDIARYANGAKIIENAVLWVTKHDSGESGYKPDGDCIHAKVPFETIPTKQKKKLFGK